ncbi:endonuclease/exonuclease/phosphatase family protein [Pseudomonas sp. Marseille-Q8238]
MTLPRSLRTLLLALVTILTIAWALVYSLTWHPAARADARVTCQADAPLPLPGQALKVMTWNVQYMAGKRYVFWYDLEDGSGRDLRPTAADLAHNLDEVARVLRDEQPDVVLLQELHDGARASDYQDQLQLLRERLSDLYPCSTSAFYWQASFVPHPKIMGSVGMKLGTLSRFRIARAERLQLPQANSNWLVRQFQPRHALLVSHLPLRSGRELTVINTQLVDPRASGDDASRQLAMTTSLLDQLENNGSLWLLGGDFNLLPPGQYQRLPESQRSRFHPQSELSPLLARYPSIPSLEETADPAWHTQFPNDPRVTGADRTLDYIIHSSRLARLDAQVRRSDTLSISDHLPLTARLLLPAD